MSEKRVVRQYEVEFKLDAVRLVEEQGYSVPEAAQRRTSPNGSHSPQRQGLSVSESRLRARTGGLGNAAELHRYQHLLG